MPGLVHSDPFPAFATSAMIPLVAFDLSCSHARGGHNCAPSVSGPAQRRILLIASLLVAPNALAATAHAVSAPSGLAPRVRLPQHPAFSWTKVIGATGYEFQVDDSADFSSPIPASTTNNRTVPTVRLPMVTSSGGCGRGQRQRDPLVTCNRRRRVGAARPPFRRWVTPLPQRASSPHWSPVAGAVGYQIEVDADGNWVSPSSYSTLGTSFQVPTPQAPRCGPGESGPSAAAGLVTPWTARRTRSCRSRTCQSPDPTTGSTVQDVVLDWLPVSGATKYEVQVGLDEDFTQPVETSTVFSTRYSPVTTYDNDQFFWRVRAIDAGNIKMAWPADPFSFRRDWPD